jgi:hypothetical protein
METTTPSQHVGLSSEPSKENTSPDETIAADAPEAGLTPEVPVSTPEVTKHSRAQNVGRTIAARAITEVAGIGVDALLMGAGSAGVGLLENVAARETLASGADVAILNKLSPHEQHGKIPRSRLQRFGHFALPLTSKLGATTGVNSILKRTVK